MVSPLSSRIINLEAKAKINKDFKPPSHHKMHKPPWQLESRRKRISGYIADRESPTEVIQTEKQMRANQIETNVKKRKVEELNFQAHNVKKDLAIAGMKYSPRSRALPIGSIDMSNVELVTASNYVSDITPSPSEGSPTNNTSYVAPSSSFENMSTYVSLIEATKIFYKGGRTRRQHIQTFASTTPRSSSSSTTGQSASLEDDETASSTSLCPRLVEKVKAYKRTCTVYKILFKSETNVISLDNALISSDTARLIIDAEEPHNIVHVSASFSRLTGIPSDQLVNHSLSKLLVGEEVDNKTVDILLDFEEPTEGSEDDLKDENQDVQAKHNIMSCKYVASHVPSTNIWSGTDKKPRISHFVLDFEKLLPVEEESVIAVKQALSKEIINESRLSGDKETVAMTIVG